MLSSSSPRIRLSTIISAMLIGGSAGSWKRASSGPTPRTCKPEPEDLPKIEEKLKVGLPDDTSSAADATKPKKAGNGG